LEARKKRRRKRVSFGEGCYYKGGDINHWKLEKKKKKKECHLERDVITKEETLVENESLVVKVND
jgi:hypothetical protein